ncbi:MAG: NUDIX hydrolase [Bacteroidia bacterium]
MNIFAINLTFLLRHLPHRHSYYFPMSSWENFLQNIATTPIFEGKIFYVKGENTPDFAQKVFDFQCLEQWRNTSISVQITFQTELDLQTFLGVFFSYFKYKGAAGGLIQNEKGEYLFIQARNRWTFPKGHIDKGGELVEATALREVQEETGLQQPVIQYALSPTFHTYLEKEKWKLKITYWYKMQANSQEKLIPQAEEGITKIVWIHRNDWIHGTEKAYHLNQHSLWEDWEKAYK